MKKNIVVALLLLLSSCAGVAYAEEPDTDTPPIPQVRRVQVPSGDMPDFLRLLGGGAPVAALPIVQGDSTPPTIMLEQDIDDDSVKAFSKALDKLSEKNPKEIRVVISSEGGRTDAGLTLIKLIERFPAKVTCIADGEVASMAFTVFESCDNRQMTLRSSFMGHRSKASIEGALTEEELRSAADSVRATSLSIAQMTCAKSKVKVSEFMAKTEGGRQWWVSPDEALKLGFVDSVVPKVTW